MVELQFKFRTSRYSREGESLFTVQYGQWPVEVMSWLWPALQDFSRLTLLDPPNLTKWDVLRHALPGLAQVRTWEAFTRIPIADLEMTDVRDLFIAIDDTFHRLWGQERGALRSSGVRSFLLRFLDAQRTDGALQRVKGAFVPKGRIDYARRPLISDQVLVVDGQAVLGPVGALSHANPQKLKELTIERLEKDLSLIEVACVKELDSYYSACAVVEDILHRSVDEESERCALQKIRDTRVKRLQDRIANLTPAERAALIAAYVRADQESQLAGPNYLGSEFIAEDLRSDMGIGPERFFSRCIRYFYFPHQIVQVAAIVLLQIRTSWNVSSVMNLRPEDIRLLKPGQYLIQSIKDKTGDDTPSVLIEGDDNPAVKAIRFALDRLNALKRRGWTSTDEKCLWLTPRSVNPNLKGQPISNLAHGLKAFRSKYSLPHFTFEQIRPQSLTLVSMQRGPVAAAEVAGHNGYGTIGGYIDHLITRRLNSSINLEFQKRWEKEVVQLSSGGFAEFPLVPIGDGSSCRDPSDPPDGEWAEAGTCNAKHCHEGTGCVNRVVLVTRKAIDEVVLLRQYYLSNWQRLHASNPAEFSKIHIPRINFNIHFYEYLRSGPYRHLIND